MVLVTVVGELQCRRGFEFVFKGPLGECRECKVRNICFHLDENRRYRVTDVRDLHHECKVHEGGVRVVEVERIPSRAALPARAALEGSVITYEDSDCDAVGCPNYRLCNPVGAVEGMKCKILSVEPGEVVCPRARNLRVVSLE
ncbi:MAG: UPF0179 family protein [Thermoplasmata archaeon]